MKKNKIFEKYGEVEESTTESVTQQRHTVTQTKVETKKQTVKPDNKKTGYKFDETTSSTSDVKIDLQAKHKQNSKKDNKNNYVFKEEKSDSDVIGNTKVVVQNEHTNMNNQTRNYHERRFNTDNLPEYWWLHAICITLLGLFVVYVLMHLSAVFYTVYVLAINLLDLSFVAIVIIGIIFIVYRTVFGRRR